MKKYAFAALACIVVGLGSLYGAQNGCSDEFFGAQPPIIVNTKLSTNTRELCFTSFAILHSGISKTPIYAAEHLTRERIRAQSERTNDFHPEERLSPDERSELEDYARSGFDRGHMAPSADMPDERSQHESFSLSNMVPQDPKNNRGIWSAIEGATRHLTNVKGEVYVVTGVIFEGNSIQRIGGRVMVPSKLFKAIYDPTSGEAGAYLVQNTETSDYTTISIADLERISGIKVFPFMDKQMQKNAMSLPEPRMRGKTKSLTPTPQQPKLSSSQYACGTKHYCSQMSSCEEARYFLSTCRESRLDGDGDGTPCEKLCR